jgi:hypothetical protein
VERPKDIKIVTPEMMSFLQDYWETFGSERGKRVLVDMRVKYCDSCFHENPYRMGYLCGQRDVVREIEEVLEMRDQTIQVEEV